MSRIIPSAKSKLRGSTLIEFALSAVTLLVVVFAAIELDRMAFVYTSLADAAKAGARYATTHGANRTGSGTDGPSGPGANPTEVLNIIQGYASLTINPSKRTVNVTYPDGNNLVGSHVKVVVQYAYDPYVVLPLGVTLSATSQGMINF